MRQSHSPEYKGLFFFRQLMRLGTLASCMLLIAAFWGPGSLIGEAAAFFIPQLIGLGFLTLVLWLISACRISLLQVLCFAVLILSSYWMVKGISEVVEPESTPASTALDAQTLTVMSLNLLQMGYPSTPLQTLITEYQPDVIVFQETAGATPRLQKFLSPQYPYEITPPSNQDADITIFSRRPILSAQKITVPGLALGDHIPKNYWDVELEIAGVPVQLFAIHPASPRGPSRLEARQKYFAHLSNRMKTSSFSGPRMVVGDWNSPIWAEHFQSFLKVQNLKTKLAGILPQTTRYFLSPKFSKLLGSKVDYIATTYDFNFEEVIIERNIGSDHFPLLAKLRFSPQNKHAELN